MSGIRAELLKTDEHDLKVKFFRGGAIQDKKDNIKPLLISLKENQIILAFMSEPTAQQI